MSKEVSNFDTKMGIAEGERHVDKQEEARMQEFITMKELMDTLKMCRKTAYRFAIENEVRVFRLGKMIRFNRADVLQAIEKQIVHY